MSARERSSSRLDTVQLTALTTGQFHLVYQPIVEIATGRVRKAEALIRWQHPERGHVSPTEFIPIAEKCNLIIALDRWSGRGPVPVESVLPGGAAAD